MKTLDEIYSEVLANKDLTAEFRALKSADEKAAFVKKLGGDASAEEIADFMDRQNHKTGELTDAELEQVVGGKGSDTTKCPSCGSANVDVWDDCFNKQSGKCYDCGYAW